MLEYPAPPAHHRTLTPNRAATAAAALRAQPGNWVLVYTARSASYLHQVATGQLAAFPTGDFETSARKSADGKYDVYLRYIGGAA